MTPRANLCAALDGNRPAWIPSTVNHRLPLRDGWRLQSSLLAGGEGADIASPGFRTDGWHLVSAPCTVLNALVKNGVYPDPRVGLNGMRIPDASDEFNAKHDLARYSHLGDARNPWKDPYWYRLEFDVSEAMRGRRLWLLFKGINYRADVWLNGRPLAGRDTLVGMYRRFRLDAGEARPGRNALAVQVYGPDHPGTPETQLEVFGTPRNFQASELMKDVTYIMGVGYDCMAPAPDRHIGLWQGVEAVFTGPVDLRDPFVRTDLPLPDTSPARLTVSSELVNASDESCQVVLRVVIEEAGVTVERQVDLTPRETREVIFSADEYSQLILKDPRLWWPANYGPQNLYHLELTVTIAGKVSSVQRTTFGIRQVTKELHIHKDWPGLRILVNGKKIFSRGGWIQPDLLMEWDARRIEAEVKYFAAANFTTVSFEDIPMPPDEFLDACDRHGILFWNCFYGSCWASTVSDWSEINGESYRDNPFAMRYAKPLPAEKHTNYPLDHDLLEACTVDILKRYRNHPSLIMYSCMGEGIPGRDVYERWRRRVRELDGTRLTTISADIKYRVEWIDSDLPTGIDDAAYPNLGQPADYYRNVWNGGEWMFSTEIPFCPSLPPVDSLRRFIPDLGQTARGDPFPLNETWAHHGANSYYKWYDERIRSQFGPPENVEDYCMKGHLITAEHHRAVSEAANHRLWDITSGSWEWKVNSSFPDVQWQIHDWYLRPMVSLYYYRLAFEPLHVQFSYLDRVVTVVNHNLSPRDALRVQAQVFDFDGRLHWEKTVSTAIGANTYRDVFPVPELAGLTPIYFVRLTLTDGRDAVVSRNFYWLSSHTDHDFQGLSALPRVRLELNGAEESCGAERLLRVRVRNPGEHVAFFIHLAALRETRGPEILPALWDANYFSLASGEERTVTCRLATGDLGNASPAVSIGGWNIESDFVCRGLEAPAEVRAGQAFAVTAQVEDTFLDGSLVDLFVDGQPRATRRVWAREGERRGIRFDLSLAEPGVHELRVADRVCSLRVVS